MVIFTFLFIRRPSQHQRPDTPNGVTTLNDNTNSSNSLLLLSAFGRRKPSVPVVNANDITALNINGKESLWIDRGWRAGDTDKDSGLSETKLLGNSNSMQSGNYTDGGTDYAEVDTRNMSTFYNCRKVRVVHQLPDAFISISRKKWRAPHTYL